MNSSQCSLILNFANYYFFELIWNLYDQIFFFAVTRRLIFFSHLVISPLNPSYNKQDMITATSKFFAQIIFMCGGFI
jgi:hypothetical protein